MTTMGHIMAILWLSNLLLLVAAGAEYVRDLEVSESAPVGTRIGFIGDGASPNSGPPYLIIPVGVSVDSDLSIEQTTGEIRTKVPLDRETRASYSLVAIPMSGDNVRVVVKVLDENDNAPTFPTSVMSIEFPENTPRDVKRTLHPARDLDLDLYNTQKYNIISGNVNNAFRLSSHRERDGVLYLDLQINGFLDRETIDAYSLVIEALDGGNPPLRGEMTVNITIQDVNDNQPIFNQSRYYATVPENATIGTSVLQVFASDNDSGENGQVQYSINRRQSDKDNIFRMDPTSGLIVVNKPLDFETKELHELVIVARDHGLQPLETTAFVSIKVTDVNDNQPTIHVIFLSEDATPKISEAAQPGEFVARISVHDPDSKTEYSNINVSLNGGGGHFGLTTRDNIIYLVIVSLPLDRESQPNYTLNVVATDTGTPPLHASRTINLQVTDINDNAPEFEQQVYHANVMEVSDPGTSVLQVLAYDKDEGNNSIITYSLISTPNTHSGWFQIDSKSGLLTTRAHVDCETDPEPKLTVVATDSGFPPLSSSATVLVTIHDVNDNEPIFDQSFYNVTVPENEAVGRCIIKVSASDPDCGINAMVNYTLGDGFGKISEFQVRPVTGEICIGAQLDFESRNTFEFPVIAADRGGLSTTAIIKIQVTDVNDNRPTFYPQEYNVSLREGGGSSSATIPVVVVAATDPDSGKFGIITYKITSGNDAGLFRIDRNTGEIFVSRPSLLSSRSQPYHKLNISASDGGNLKSLKDAEVYISIIDATQRPPIFEYPRYTYSVSENVNEGTVIGTVKVIVNDNGDNRNVRYSIYSGDPNGFFRIGASTGVLSTASQLDHETKANVLLNIQATAGEPPVHGHTQVYIEIEDINDNAPEFESPTVRISLPENVDVHTPVYAAHAQDKDSGPNGLIRYKITSNSESIFKIEPKLGHVTLVKHLDYETAHRHSLIVTATDSGQPPLSANLTVFVEVQDVNDNAPVFDRALYSTSVLESLPVNSQILQLTALDQDTGNNARITYKILPSNVSNDSDIKDIFGVFPNSGWLYLKEPLDRESRDTFTFTVAATDNGTPSETATAKVIVNVLDANDNDPLFSKGSYDFSVEENLKRGTVVGKVVASDVDSGVNSVIRYSLIPSNSSFHINAVTGEITTKEPLDREQKEHHDLVAEARDQGSPPRSSRVAVKIHVLDVNDNSPEIVDPQEDVVSVREEQPAGTEVVKVRAVDSDNGYNASISYSILNSKDSDGSGVFTIDPNTGVIRTRMVLDHEEKTIYRLAIAATDRGTPSKQSVRMLRVEVLDVNDNRPTFTGSSLIFRVREDVDIGHVVGSVAISEPSHHENMISENNIGYITYTLNSLSSDKIRNAFEIDRVTGSLVVARELDRETQSEYRLEVRALDMSSMNNPQSSTITVRVDIADVNDNHPKWLQDPIIIPISENTDVGSSVYNFTAMDADSGNNGELRYSLLKQLPSTNAFTVDYLTGSLILSLNLDYESIQEYILIVQATDQSTNVSERLTSSLTVRIIVTDFNDNPPKFVIPVSSTAYLNEMTTVGMTITHLVAVDQDSGDNGRVTYIITGGNDNGLFSLGYDTGALTLAKPLTELHTYLLNVSATDHGTPTMHTHMELKLIVQGYVDETPKFSNSAYRVVIAEDIAIGGYVTQVSANTNSDFVGNISYFIPGGFGNDTFEVNANGRVTTKKNLDRETTPEYILPIYTVDSISQSYSLFDVATVYITLSDVNDHPPTFQIGSCYRLTVPENSDTNVIHTVVARDLDIGRNGEITYEITKGNVKNKFSIDAKTGELTARPLDREIYARYQLLITAQDRGMPSMTGVCNISVYVDDENDNDPKFDLLKYSSTILEDIPIDTSILRVHATDLDQGINGRIVYSLSNESHWLFRIDNKSGIITTAGLFDRERQSEYNFLVVATDGGKYNARSAKVPVTIRVDDINDNKPIFISYPFKEKVAPYIQPGQTILKVQANDFDLGTNSEIVYSIKNNDNFGKFRINPNTGILTATQTLASETGKVIYLNVVATDKGNPPKSSFGLVEVIVGEIPESSPQLRFQNETYEVTISENIMQFRDIVQVSAVRTDGRRQRIIYSFGNGNEDNIFVINSESGMIQVRDSKFLDYELHHEITLVVEAKTEGSPNLHGFCEVRIKIKDENDNAPKFTQPQYNVAVWEGNKKGAFVLQVVAFDADEGQNSRILYHIVDGNHDNAFKIEPAFSGILKTNIVLDREIRDNYRLTVIATDEGVPQMTGTTRIRINVVDVNDNQPTFPPHSIITVREDVPVGTVLTTVTANDVDTNPPLTYSFPYENIKEYMDYFSIDRYSAKVILKKPLDFESIQEFQLKIEASDTAHSAQTTLTIKVKDVNDNAPQFSHIAYQGYFPDVHSSQVLDILTVNATDADIEENAKIEYSLVNPLPGFSIGKKDGILRAFLSNISNLNQDVQITVNASDGGTPSLFSLATVRVKVNGDSAYFPSGNKNIYRISVAENATKGTALLHLSKTSHGTKHGSNYRIIDGNDEGAFEISNPSGILILTKTLDRETIETYNLKLTTDTFAYNSSIVNIVVTVEDVNDNAPVFKQIDSDVTISEGTTVGTSIHKFEATDADTARTLNSDITFDISSGNDDNMFKLDPNTGILFVNNSLDYDDGTTQYSFVIRACDKGELTLCTLNTFQVILEDVNDNEPKFPVSEYLEYVGENEPTNTAVFTAHATDFDKGLYGQLNYSIEASNNYNSDDSWKLFHIDSNTGVVTTNAVFDYEQKNRYLFMIKALDFGGKFSTVKVRIEVEGKDEFHPQFTERTYKFILATSVNLPTGYLIGHVVATDKDKGPDGRIVYQLTTQNSYFKINRTTGAVLIKKKFSNSDIGREVSLVVTASSGRQGSLTNMTVVEITLDPLADPGTNLAINSDGNSTVSAQNGGIADWALGLLISIILLIISFGAIFVFLHMRNKRQKKINKPNLNESVSPSNNYVDPSSFDTIPIRGGVGVVGVGVNNQFAPPKYDEIPPYGGAGHAASSNSGAATTSELSGSEQSGSSGRGSAEDGEDGEDEEIRMINEGPLQRDSGIHRQNDGDNLSDISVRNTQEYLARLGIINNNSTAIPQVASRLCSDPRAGSSKDSLHHHQSVPLENLHIFDGAGTSENDISNFYAKLSDVAGSDRASSADEGTVSNSALGPTMEQVMAIGGYGEVKNVNHQPSMNGSLSSIVHSEEELAGSYNWDYLLDWGPQYQPLAHVFSEIARLKDDTVSVHSGASGTSSIKSKNSAATAKALPPPMITSAAPRAIPMPVLSSRGGPGGHNLVILPRSPINHESSCSTFTNSAAMSPSFSPSLSPLATKSPSISPMVTPGLPTAHHVMARQPNQTRNKTVVDTELRI